MHLYATSWPRHPASSGLGKPCVKKQQWLSWHFNVHDKLKIWNELLIGQLQSNLITIVPSGPQNCGLTVGRCSEATLYSKYAVRYAKKRFCRQVVAIRRWSLAQVWLYMEMRELYFKYLESVICLNMDHGWVYPYLSNSDIEVVN